ncbi:hypothetical protein FRC10_000223 [Ceratobasidium sp. 414]|nr:hypothetical protein FRC10_000223 [Ceratobasidium sp. 414]
MSSVPTTPSANIRFEPRLVKEEDWLLRFTEAMDSLDLDRWSTFWTDDVFCQFGNAPRQEGKAAMIKFFEPQLKLVDRITHTFTALVTYEVKGDQQGRKITVPALAVIHKRQGEEKISGLETYGDTTTMKEVVEEVMSGKK